MAGPNVGILDKIAPQQVMTTEQALRLQLDRAKQMDASALNDANLADKNIDLQNKVTEQGYLPAELEAKKAKLNQDLEKAKLENKKAQQAQELWKIDQAHRLSGSVVDAPVDQKEMFYQNAKAEANKLGIETNDWPEKYDANAEAKVNQAYQLSGQRMKDEAAKTARLAVEYKSPTVQLSLERNKEMQTNTLKAQEAVNVAATKAVQKKEILQNFNASASAMAAGTMPFFGPMQALAGLPEAQKAQKYQEQLALNVLQDTHFGRVTNKEMEIVRRSIPNISTNPSARKRIVEQLTAMADRDIEKQKFYQKMVTKGVIDNGIIESLWNNFMEENPAIDLKTGKVNTKNIDAWEKYTSNAKINKMSASYEDNNPPQQSMPQQSAPQNQPQVAPVQSVVGKNGVTYTRNDLDALIAAGARPR